MVSVNAYRALGACLLVSSLSAASTSPARAEPPAPAPPAARPVVPVAEEAIQLYQEGITARQQGDWEKARASLLKSWELQQHFQTAANLGEMELKLGQHREAAEHLAYFLKEAPASVPDADRARGQTMLDQARASLAIPPVAPPREPAPAMKPMERPPVDRKEGPKMWIIVTGTAATALGVAMGTGFAIASEVKRHERDAQDDATRGCHGRACEPYNAPERARSMFLNASSVSFLAAGAIGAGTLTYSLMTRAQKTQGQATATVAAGPGGVAGTVEFTW